MRTWSDEIEIIDGEYPDTITKYGKTLKAVGLGKYPYDCIAKDKFPNAMIYIGDGCWDVLQKVQPFIKQ